MAESNAGKSRQGEGEDGLYVGFDDGHYRQVDSICWLDLRGICYAALA